MLEPTWELTEIKLPVNEVKSDVIRRNASVISDHGIDYYILYATKDTKAKGWFRKDFEPTRSTGRFICDLMQQELGNDGFFTTDEIRQKMEGPNLYGLTKSQVDYMTEKVNANPQEDLVIILAYNQKMANAACKWLEKTVEKYLPMRKIWGTYLRD